MTDTANAAPPLRGDETRLYTEHAVPLARSVRRAVNTSDAIIEDACQYAWTQLLRHQPDREYVYGWLRTTAIREAWMLSARERRTVSLDLRAGEAASTWTLADAIPGTSVDLELDAREALRAVACLRDNQRYTLSRLIAGLSYAEIQAEAGLSYRQVDRHLARARAALRR